MKVLIVGGTGLISTAISREFLTNGDVELTLVNRGVSDARIPAGAKTVISNRNEIDAFERQMTELGEFDCVIDMICFTPAQAESTIRAFRGRTKQLIFAARSMSTASPPDAIPIARMSRCTAITVTAQIKFCAKPCFSRRASAAISRQP